MSIQAPVKLKEDNTRGYAIIRLNHRTLLQNTASKSEHLPPVEIVYFTPVYDKAVSKFHEIALGIPKDNNRVLLYTNLIEVYDVSKYSGYLTYYRTNELLISYVICEYPPPHEDSK